MLDMKYDQPIATPDELRALGFRPILGGDGEAEVEKKEAAPAAWVPSEEFKAFQAQIGGAIQGMTDNIAALAQALKPAAAAPAENLDEEIEEALRTGTGAATIRKAIDKGVAKGIAEHVNPQMAAGLEAIQRITQDFATTRVGADGKSTMPYYKRFEKEIGEVLGRLPAGTKISPETYQWAHDLVAGRHVMELTAEAIEQANRKAVDEKPGSQGGALRTARTTTTGANDIPTVAEFLGEESAQTLEQMGRSPDQHAKNLGYADWKDYVVKSREADAMVGASRGVATTGKGSRR